MVGCKIARQLFNVPRRIARIRMPDFAEHPELMGEDGFCIDALISPERSVTTYLHNLIELPEALQVVAFAADRISVVRSEERRVGTEGVRTCRYRYVSYHEKKQSICPNRRYH